VRPLHELINTTLAALLGGFVAYIEHGTAVVPPEKLLRAVLLYRPWRLVGYISIHKGGDSGFVADIKA
jgi:hypothetical protein